MILPFDGFFSQLLTLTLENQCETTVSVYFHLSAAFLLFVPETSDGESGIGSVRFSDLFPGSGIICFESGSGKNEKTDN